jgi:hypothetical protein
MAVKYSVGSFFIFIATQKYSCLNFMNRKRPP